MGALSSVGSRAPAGGPGTLSFMVEGPTAWLVLGGGGHARVLADVIGRLAGVLAAVAGRPDGPAWGVPVLDGDDEALRYAAQQGLVVALGVGDNAARGRLVVLVASAGVRMPPLVATTSTLARDADLGDGVVVLEHAHVGPASLLASGVIVNTAAVVEHDCVVGEAAHLAPASVLLGGARVGARTLVGSGACILPGVVVGSDCVVGAGAVVREDVPDGATVAGVPAAVVGH